VKKSRSEKCKKCDAGPTQTDSLNPKFAINVSLTPTASASALNTTTKSLELVEWRDANFYVDVPDDAPEDYIIATVGWIEEDDTWLKITSELTPDGERAVTRVPLVNVVRRRGLVTPSWPSTWTTSPEPTE
jgi:hypothetical protein